MAQHIGNVKWFNNAEGYGFLGRDDGTDIFVHFSSILLDGYKSLKEGERVSFDIVQGKQGLQAEQVKHLNRKPKKTGLASPVPAVIAATAEEIVNHVV